MFVDLVQLLALDDRRLPSGQFIFITDSNIDGNFMLHHFLSMYLRGKRKNQKLVVIALFLIFLVYTFPARCLFHFELVYLHPDFFFTFLSLLSLYLQHLPIDLERTF